MSSLINKSFFWVTLCVLSIAVGQHRGDPVVWSGVRAFYNYDTAKGIEILAQARLDYPENPTVHLTWVAARWLHAQANDSVDGSYAILNSDLNAIVPVYESLAAKFPDDPDYQLYLGSAKGLKARVHLGRKEWLETLSAAYRGFSIIKSVAQHNPDMIDAQLPIGIVEYYAGMSSFIVKWAVAIFGLETTKSAGQAKIEQAASGEGFSWIEASSICGFLFLWVDSDIPKALRYSEKLARSFPANFYFQTLYAESLIRSGDTKNAHKQIQRMTASLPLLTPIQQRWYSAYLDYESALLAFREGQRDLALELVERSISTYHAELDIVLTNAWLLKGKLLDLKGDRIGAISAYRSCIARDNFAESISQAKHYLASSYLNE